MAQNSITIDPDILKFQMTEKRHTLDSLSHACGISTKQISRIRQNGRTTPETLERIATALKCQPSELQTPRLLPQHQSWGVFWGHDKHADNDELLPENGWQMEHIQGWYALEHSINELKNHALIRFLKPKFSRSPKVEKKDREEGHYHEISTTIISTSDSVCLTLKICNNHGLKNSMKIFYKPGRINTNGLLWEDFYPYNIFQFNNTKTTESELLVRVISKATAYFSDFININNKELSAKSNQEVYLIQSIDKSSGDCTGYEEFSSMYELEIALVGYLSRLDSEEKPQIINDSDSNSVDSNFSLNIIFNDKNSLVKSNFPDLVFKISKVCKVNEGYQETCWNKDVQDKWKSSLSKSIQFNQDEYEMLCESYDLPEKSLCLNVADNISIKTVTDFINEA